MKNIAFVLFGAALALAIAAATTAYADVALPAIISDGMVLQQGASVPIWGSADEGETVTVSFQNQKASTKAKDGKWMVRLKNLKPGGPFTLTVVGRNRIEIRNVLVGEVWVASGQSNMAWPVSRSSNAEAEIAGSKNPSIRLLTVPRLEAEAPVKDVKASWQECGPETVASFSAVAYFFGRQLQRALNVPIGLINSSVGGTPIEAWMSEAALKANPEFRSILEAYPQALERFKQEQAKHAELAEKAKAEGKPVPRAPNKPWRPAGLYNGMIAPLQPYAIRGVIWYQGESNANRAYQYRALFPAMIRDWRQGWRAAATDLPFLFVQLAAFGKPSEKVEEEPWAELREAQLLTLSAAPKTAMVVTIDVGDEDIHPPKKQPVGERLALAARAIAYGEKIVYSGPIYDSMRIEGNKVILSFKHVGSGLEARGGELKGFAVAGQDRVFHPAKAEIKGRRVIVSSPQVMRPVAVRYAWAKYPTCNLYNKEGLPASPFRTDSWPGVTQHAP